MLHNLTRAHISNRQKETTPQHKCTVADTWEPRLTERGATLSPPLPPCLLTLGSICSEWNGRCNPQHYFNYLLSLLFKVAQISEWVKFLFHGTQLHSCNWITVNKTEQGWVAGREKTTPSDHSPGQQSPLVPLRLVLTMPACPGPLCSTSN
jgi:hypothetical protein